MIRRSITLVTVLLSAADYATAQLATDGSVTSNNAANGIDAHRNTEASFGGASWRIDTTGGNGTAAARSNTPPAAPKNGVGIILSSRDASGNTKAVVSQSVSLANGATYQVTSEGQSPIGTPAGLADGEIKISFNEAAPAPRPVIPETSTSPSSANSNGIEVPALGQVPEPKSIVAVSLLLLCVCVTERKLLLGLLRNWKAGLRGGQSARHRNEPIPSAPRST